VRDPVETDLGDAESCAHRVEILGVIAGRVEDSLRADDRGAVTCEGGVLLDARIHRALQGRTADDARLARAAVVERDEGVAGEEEPQGEAATHEVRQGSSAGVRFPGPVSATELELGVFDSVRVIGSGRVGSAISARLRERGIAVSETPELILLCVPDEAIADV